MEFDYCLCLVMAFSILAYCAGKKDEREGGFTDHDPVAEFPTSRIVRTRFFSFLCRRVGNHDNDNDLTFSFLAI